MITNTLLVLGLTLGAVGYMKIQLDIKALRSECKQYCKEVETSIHIATDSIDSQIRHGNILTNTKLDNVEFSTAELINKSTKDINFITTRETNKIICTPLRMNCDGCK